MTAKTLYHQAEALALLAKLVALQATSQPATQSGPKSLDRLFASAKKWVERYELASKVWAWRRSISLTLSIAPWWEYLVSAVRWLIG